MSSREQQVILSTTRLASGLAEVEAILGNNQTLRQIRTGMRVFLSELLPHLGLWNPREVEGVTIADSARLMPDGRTDGGGARCLIGPTNSADQARLWAAALNFQGEVAASALQIGGRTERTMSAEHFLVPHDVGRYSRTWAGELLNLAAVGFSHILLESQQPIFGALTRGDPVAEARILKARGLALASVCHGSDIRVPSIHRDFEEFSPFFWPDPIF